MPNSEGLSKTTTNEQFQELIRDAKAGRPESLNTFLQDLYQKGKRNLLKLTRSETEAEEHFSAAVARFWVEFVNGDRPLPKANIEGYIYTMARFMCIDQHRKKSKLRVVSDEETLAQSADQGPPPDQFSEEDRAGIKKEAFERARVKLSDKCQQLFNVIIEQGVEKSREIYSLLGLEDARSATVLRYDCTRRLKVLAALELELLLNKRN